MLQGMSFDEVHLDILQRCEDMKQVFSRFICSRIPRVNRLNFSRTENSTTEHFEEILRSVNVSE